MLDTSKLTSGFAELFEGPEIPSFGLEFCQIDLFKEDCLLITNWNWDYLKAHEFQKHCLEFIRKNPKLKIFIICSHPHCFTMGRGLQRSKGMEKYNLVDFDESLESRLNVPLHKIKRGGGLTFHYPGQWVCYPIVTLSKDRLDVYKLMNFLLSVVQKTLEQEFLLEDLSHEEKLMGLWLKKQKIASIGVAVTRLVTYHGLAFNLLHDEKMSNELKLVYPCGLPGETYIDLETVLKGRDNTLSSTSKSSLTKKFHDLAVLNLKEMLFF